MNIAEINAGERVMGQFLLADAKKGVKDNGAVYWTLSLQDSSGVLDAKKWDYNPEDDAILVKGNVVYIDGEVLRYRNALQMKVRSCEAVDQDKVEWSRFISCAPMSGEIMKKNSTIHWTISPTRMSVCFPKRWWIISSRISWSIQPRCVTTMIILEACYSTR